MDLGTPEVWGLGDREGTRSGCARVCNYLDVSLWVARKTFLENLVSGSGTGIVTPYDTHRAIDLDGAADWYVRNADLVGNADGPLGIVSCWFRVDGGNGTFRYLYANQNGRVILLLDNNNRLWFRARTAVPVTVMEFVTTPTYLAGSGWHQVMISYDSGVPIGTILVDGAVPVLTTNTVAGGNIEYTRPTHAVGQTVPGLNSEWNGGWSEFYMNFAEYLDLTAVANQVLLRHPNGQPPNIGAQGQLVTGNQPIGYFVEEGGVMVNRGSGGVFVAAGAPALSADSPKDRWVASLIQHRRKRIHYGG